MNTHILSSPAATAQLVLTLGGLKKASDHELVMAYRDGHEIAFEALVKRYKTRVYNTIFHIVRERSADPQFLAQDLTQDTFIKVVDSVKSGKYREENRFLPWLLRIARNLAIDHYRRVKRVPTVSLEVVTNAFDGATDYEPAAESLIDLQIKQETHVLLRSYIEQLPETQREVLLLRHFAGLSFKEIAELTDVSINTALGRMRYALINLRRRMTTSMPADYAQTFTQS